MQMYANTCWGFLTLAVTFGLAVLGLPPDQVWLRPYFIGTAGACAVIGISMLPFSWPLARRFWKRLAGGALSRSTWKGVAATEPNLAAYIRSSPLVQRLDDEIARTEKLPIKSDETTALLEQENARFFGIADVARLDTLLEENQEAALRIASYSFTDDHISRGASVACLFDMLGARLGEDRLRELNMLRQWQHITESGIENRINAYSEFSKNHKIRVRVPFAPDFNLIPIEEGLSLAREQCKNSAFGKSIPKGKSTGNELLAYLERLSDRMVFYGSFRGHKERMPFGRWSPRF
jgi:hypothetical protein